SCSVSLKAIAQSPTSRSSSNTLSKGLWHTFRRGRPRSPSIHSIPALSRTHSPEPTLDSPLPQTPTSEPILLHPNSHLPFPSLELNTKPFPPLHPALARLEKKSRLKKPINCTMC